MDNEMPGLVTNDFTGWRPGDPCYACGSTDTIWEKDGKMIQPHCNGCGRDDFDYRRTNGYSSQS